MILLSVTDKDVTAVELGGLWLNRMAAEASTDGGASLMLRIAG